MYQEFKKKEDKFYFREYPENSKFYGETDEMVIGKVKM